MKIKVSTSGKILKRWTSLSWQVCDCEGRDSVQLGASLNFFVVKEKAISTSPVGGCSHLLVLRPPGAGALQLPVRWRDVQTPGGAVDSKGAR
jgi:hypothetical protein